MGLQGMSNEAAQAPRELREPEVQHSSPHEHVTGREQMPPAVLSLAPITTQLHLLRPLAQPGAPDGTQQSPSTSVPTGQLTEHCMSMVPCSFPAETVLLLALRGRNERQPKFLAYTKKKNEKLSLDVHKVPARNGL